MPFFGRSPKVEIEVFRSRLLFYSETAFILVISPKSVFFAHLGFEGRVDIGFYIQGLYYGSTRVPITGSMSCWLTRSIERTSCRDPEYS